MKKSISIVLITILIIGGILANLPSKVYGYSAGMSASSRNVTVGDTFTVTVSFGIGVSAAQFGFSYSSNLVENTGRSIGDLHSGQFGFFGANNVRSATFTFRAKEAGTATISASGVSITYDYTDENGNPATKYGEGAGSASTTITINPKPTPTPTANPTPVPTKEPQQPEPTREPDRPNENDEPKVTDTPEPTQTTTPTPTPEPTEEPNEGEQNETNETESNETTNNETDNNKEKAPNKIIKMDESDVVTIKNEENDVMIKAKPIAIKDENVTLSVALIEEETERFNDLTKMTEKIKGNKKFYDIKLLKDGLAIEPNGYVTVYLPIPEGYNKKRLEAYSINEQTEKYEKRTGVVQGNYYTFTTDKLEAFALVEKEAPSKTSRIITMVLMLLGAIAILAIITIVVKKIR